MDELALSADLDMKQLEFTKAFPKIQKVIGLGNANLSNHEFWKLAKQSGKEDLKLLEDLIYVTFEIARISSTLLYPFCP